MRKIAFTVLFLIAGCAGQPTQQEVDRADAGTPPGPEFYEKVRSAVRVGLKDPDSLKDLIVGEPRKCGYRVPLDFTSPPEFGYCTTISYNAKNSYGGYAGVHSYNILYRNGIIVEQEELR